MPTLKLVSWNCEWMNSWFAAGDGPPAFRLPTFPTVEGEINDTVTTASRAAGLIRDLDPDVLALQEGPSRVGELELFVAEYLSDAGVPRYSCLLSDSGGAQKTALLWKPGVVSATRTPHAKITRLIDPWQADVTGTAVLEEYGYTRVPLVVDVKFGAEAFQILVCHTKSNFINHGEQLWNDPSKRQEFIVAALLNRRRNANECQHIRDYLDDRLDAQADARIIVVGDLNDGPGRDYFESLYLAHNVTDVLIGSVFEPERAFTHAQHDVPKANRWTAEFDDFVGMRVPGKIDPVPQPNTRVLLDHILLSPGFHDVGGLHKSGPGRVGHAAYEAHLANNGAKRQDRPSDHRPVSVRLAS
jgi:endonuclease/exonuclease/phosphatase family metal-dependent hydrolase